MSDCDRLCEVKILVRAICKYPSQKSMMCANEYKEFVDNHLAN